MATIRVEATIQEDGELHLSNLPYRRGERVEAIIVPQEIHDQARREAALTEFLKLARASRFRSEGAYPTRDELHDRD